MATGPWTKGDLTSITNIDPADLAHYQFADGVPMSQAVAYLNGLAAAFSQRQFANQGVGAIMRYLCAPPTTNQAIQLNTGSIEWTDATEFGAPNPQRLGLAGGVCIPREKTGAIGMTWQASRRLTSESFIATAGRWVAGAVETLRKDLLETMLIGGIAARSHPGGNGSVSPAWMGGNSQNYVPPIYNGASFTSDDHYSDNSADSDAGRLEAFGLMRDNLWEHGYYSEDSAPILLLHGAATLADVRAVTGYAARAASLVAYGGGSTTNHMATAPDAGISPAVFHGVWEPANAWCCQIGGIPDNYFIMVKSFGLDSPLNPIQHWVSDDVGPGIVIQGIDTNPPSNTSPLARVSGYIQWGFGVKDPAAGAVGYIGGGGTYVDPTTVT